MRLTRGRFSSSALQRRALDEEREEESTAQGRQEFDAVGSEDTPLLNRDRKAGRVSDYIGGSEWEKYRERDPRVVQDNLREAVFPESFYGTRLQRQIFPEDVGERAYVEYDTLPPYEGDVIHRVEEAEQLLNSGVTDEREIEFWFRNSDMPDTGFPLKIECDKIQDYRPEEYDFETSLNDVFTPFCPTIRDAPGAEQTLTLGQEITGKVMGAHVQHGVLVDLGANIAGLIPMYHHQDSRGLDSKCLESLGVDKFDESFGQDKEVTVKVHALRLQRYGGSGRHVYRFPVEVELLEPHLEASVLAKPLEASEGDSKAPVTLHDPRQRSLWEEMAQVTGREVSEAFLAELDSMADEYEMSRKEQFDNIKDMEIFDPNHDDFAKKRGSPDPMWGLEDLLADGK